MKKLLQHIYSGEKGYTLGTSTRTGNRIRLPDDESSTYVHGVSGMGKTTLLARQILTAISKGDRSIIVLDPHSSLVRTIAQKCPEEHAKRVIYFSPTEQQKRVLSINPFEIRNPNDFKEVELRANAFMQVVEHTWALSIDRAPTMQNTLETFARTSLAAYETQRTNFLHLLMLTRPDEVGEYYRRNFRQHVTNPGQFQNWAEWVDARQRKEDFKSSRQKIKHVVTSNSVGNVLCQPTSSIRLNEIIRDNKVLLVGLHGLQDEFIKLIGSFVLTQALTEVWLRGEDPNSPCNIYADEFYYFHPQSFEKIIDEGRKYRVSCTIASQSLGKLKERAAEAALRCRNVIVFRSSPRDTVRLKKFFCRDTDHAKEIEGNRLSSLPRYEAFVRYEKGRQLYQARVSTGKLTLADKPEVARSIWKQSVNSGMHISEIEKYHASLQNPIVSDQEMTDNPQNNGASVRYNLGSVGLRQRIQSSHYSNDKTVQTPLSKTPIAG